MRAGDALAVRACLEHGHAAATMLQRALLQAARSGSGTIVALLLQHGADPAFVDAEHASPLHEAAAHDHADCVERLMAATTSSSRLLLGATPLHTAARAGAVRAARLLARQVPVAACDADGNTALHVAIAAHQWEVARMLLEYLRRTNSKDALNVRDAAGRTPAALANKISLDALAVAAACNPDL